jgi:hypothetical protein
VIVRSAFRGLNYVIAALVLVQAAVISYGLATLHHWVDQDGGELTKAVSESDDGFPGVGGFMIHGMNGMMLIPILTLVMLIISFFAKIPGGTKHAAILLGLVVVQVVLGILSHEIPYAIALHAINAFAIFSMAAVRAHRMGAQEALDTRSAAIV